MRWLISSFLAFGLSTSAAVSADKDPLHIVVSLKEQHLKVYRGSEVIAQSNISSGKRGHATPTGVFSILGKKRFHRSNIYRGAPMPYMQRLTWSGIALHASNSVPRRPASHGCVRLPNRFARQLFRYQTRGAHVIIEKETTAPVIFSHEKLFQPMKTWKPQKSNDQWVNDHIRKQNQGFIAPNPDYPARIFITRRTFKDDMLEVQRLLNKLGYNAGEVDGTMGPKTWGAITAYQEVAGLKKDGKITDILLNSLYRKAVEVRPKNGRIMVRQHHKPVFEAGVTIKDAHMALGSHLITTFGYDAASQKTGWTVISLDDRIHRKTSVLDGTEPDLTSSRRSVAQALDRIVMTGDTRKQISRFLTPGSSITISDNGMSIETGAKGTDFIVLTKPKKNLNLVAGEGDAQGRT